MITGEVGTGKTVAVRAALAALDPTRHTVIHIGNPATVVRHEAIPARSTTWPFAALSPPTPSGRRSPTSPPPMPRSARSYQQNEHPADTMNTKPRARHPPGGASAVTHTLTANDAATLTLNVA